MKTKKGWIASILNFFVPGLGHIYARNIRKGITLYFLFFLIVFSLRFVSYNFILFLISVCLIICYVLYLLISGYKSVNRNQIYESNRSDKWYFYVAIVFIHIVIFNSIPRKVLDDITPINFASIPTPSMEPTLNVGDILAYKKTKAIERNEVIIFKHPEDINTFYIERSIGLPGDSVQIINGIVFLNGDTLRNTPDLKYRHLISTNGQSINPRVFKELLIDDYYETINNGYLAHITFDQAKELQQFEFIKSVNLTTMKKNVGNKRIFPEFYNNMWNEDHYGGIYVPKKGDIIQLSPDNISTYVRIIELENESVELKEFDLFINGKLTETYEVKDNYYFMLGDSRHNSMDSRYWGFLPETLIIGQAMYIYWSKATNRIGKEIN